jgi:NADP-dependent aldehyde dehydrogenase
MSGSRQAESGKISAEPLLPGGFARITGAILIGHAEVAADKQFEAINPATGETLPVSFSSGGPLHVDRACALAEAAFASFSETHPDLRARFLEAIADKIAALGDELTDRAMAETGLPRPRLEGETGRTVGQLRLFAEVVRRGEWLHATIDRALPERKPLPRPDIRRRHIAIGPVAVFGASNFPLAFSVAGGDTASAFAAGCPVVVKGHPAHPGTGELVARAIRAAVESCGLHEGVFSYLPGPEPELGAALVADPRIQAVGFTGSRGGGLALVGIAQQRPQPIPVYAEMSSVNPVLLFPAALASRGEELASAFAQSLAMGAGQFCTNPGLLIGTAGTDLDRFANAAANAISGCNPQTMLSRAIRSNFDRGVDALADHEAVRVLARGSVGDNINQAAGALFMTDSESFSSDPALAQEVFGSSSIVVACRDNDDMARVVSALEGQLTATLVMDPGDEPLAAPFVPLIEAKAGRILANGWPTGVEVCEAMVHGGPYPATSDQRTTSVGTLAIERFLRPVCYQNMPQQLLPPALRDENPWNVPQRVNLA